MGNGGEFKVINLRQKRLEKKYKKLFDLYDKFTSFFRSDKQPNRVINSKCEKKARHGLQRPMTK